MNKKRSKQKARFVNTYLSHILISIVALIECLILLTFTTFSWIESSSSLEILTRENENLEIADELNYQIDFKNSETGYVDLSAFFRQSRDFKYSLVSSADGKTFFMPKANSQKTAIGTPYRAGDTTDYNTSYRTLDFRFNNTSSSTVYYGFENASPFTSDIEDSTLKSRVEKAFRFSVDVNGTAKPNIYANAGEYQSSVGVVDVNGGTQTCSPKSITAVSGSLGTQAFRVNANTTTGVTVRVWLEEKYLGTLTPEEQETVFSSNIEVDIKFKRFTATPTAIKTPIYVDNSKGIFDTSNTLYLHGIENGTPTSIDLAWSSVNNRFENNTGLDLDTVSLDNAYFRQTYGGKTYDAYCNGTPQTDENGVTFKPLSVTKAANYYVLGTWGGSTNIYFDPQYLTYYSTSDYNDQSSGIETKIPMSDVDIYCNPGGTNANRQTATLKYDSDGQRWSAEVPENFVHSNLYFYYCSRISYYSPNVAGTLKFDAPTPTKYNNIYEFKPLGFTDSDNTLGVGSWGALSTIDISSELIESEIAPTDRYKIEALFGNTYYSYYMQPRVDHICHYAYVPESAGSSDSNQVGFTKEQSGGTSISFARSTSDGLDKYYIAKNADNGTYEGGWTLAVIVDGTAEHLVYELMQNENNNPSLCYTHDGETWYNFTRLDDYRWYTVLNNNIATLPVRWTAYGNTGTYFDYTFRTADGIYMTIVEK
ncbi:MAG: hypothetical protein KBS62_07390 [Oscillospiraceae bacterium]|nr:hypothetical protein [Candidatus Ruminococcus equi]